MGSHFIDPARQPSGGDRLTSAAAPGEPFNPHVTALDPPATCKLSASLPALGDLPP